MQQVCSGCIELHPGRQRAEEIAKQCLWCLVSLHHFQRVHQNVRERHAGRRRGVGCAARRRVAHQTRQRTKRAPGWTYTKLHHWHGWSIPGKDGCSDARPCSVRRRSESARLPPAWPPACGTSSAGACSAASSTSNQKAMSPPSSATIEAGWHADRARRKPEAEKGKAERFRG